MGRYMNQTWLITNFKMLAFSSSTKAIWVILGIARSNGSDASGTPLPSRCNSTCNSIVTAKMHHVYVFVCVQLKEKPTTKNKKQ